MGWQDVEFGAGTGPDEVALHALLAARIAREPRGAAVARREARELALIAALAVLAPVSVVALASGASPALAGGLAALTGFVAATVLRALRREHSVDPLRDVPTWPGASATRPGAWAPVFATHVIPARHHRRPAAETLAVLIPQRLALPAKSRRIP
jgi:hypothetical protein